MTVLILARDLDPQIDRVVTCLVDRDVPVFRTDLSAFPQYLTVQAQLGPRGWDGELATPHRSIALREVRSVWYRHPSHFVFPETLSRPERRHATTEARCGISGILSWLDALWVNYPSREADAVKPAQLHVARACGLDVPATLITNRPDAVRAFAAALDGPVAVKNLSAAAIAEAGGVQVAFTRRLDPDDLGDLDGVETTTHLFQEFIEPKAFEARVTVVGDQFFAAAIHAGTDATRIDFRTDYASLTYSIVEPPEHVRAGMAAFMKEFGLLFGAFDFAVTPDRRWHLFEFTDRPVLRTSRSWRPVSGVPADRLPARSGTSVLFRWLDGACGADGVGRGSEGSGDHPRQGLAVVDGAVARGCSARAGRSVPAAA